MSAETLGEAIRLAREAKEMTLRELARRLDVSAPFLSDVEHDRRKTNKLDKIAEILGVPVEELEALDNRLPPSLKDFLAKNPRLVSLLKDMQHWPRVRIYQAVNQLAQPPKGGA